MPFLCKKQCVRPRPRPRRFPYAQLPSTALRGRGRCRGVFWTYSESNSQLLKLPITNSFSENLGSTGHAGLVIAVVRGCWVPPRPPTPPAASSSSRVVRPNRLPRCVSAPVRVRGTPALCSLPSLRARPYDGRKFLQENFQTVQESGQPPRTDHKGEPRTALRCPRVMLTA